MDGLGPDAGEIGDGGVLTPDPATAMQAILSMQNIALHLSPEALLTIGFDAIRDYDTDRGTMDEWLKAMQRGIDLAKLVKKEKTYPFDGAANVKYPLVTTAALQFNARAYPAVVPGDAVVKAKVYGQDPQGLKAARGERISAHMSWQLMCEIEEWEEETDKLLAQLPIVGSMIRKVWYDPAQGRPRCRVVMPGSFVINQNVKNIADAPRLSELLSLFPNEIQERINAGIFREDEYQDDEDEDRQKPEEFIEQHCRLDLDGDDYTEPYIVTVHKKSRKVARIVADFGAQDVKMGPQGIISIRRGSYFVPYQFLPSMDGGFFGTGLGILLGDISDTVNSIINMMMDAGHYNALGGGFLGSDFRIKGGSQRFKPGEWKQVEARGGDIRSGIVPMQFLKPDATMFQLLGMLIEAGKDVSSVKDIMTGDHGGKTMTATTTMALIEQGMMVFTAAYKRIFRSMRMEFKLLAKINAETVSPEAYNAFQDGQQPYDPRADYNAADMDIVPVADPQSVTKTQQAAKAQLLMDLAKQGMIGPMAAAERVMEAMGIENTDELQVPGAMMHMEMQLAGAQADLAMKRAQIELTMAEIERLQARATMEMAQADATVRTTSLDALRLMLEGQSKQLELAIGAGVPPPEPNQPPLPPALFDAAPQPQPMPQMQMPGQMQQQPPQQMPPHP